MIGRIKKRWVQLRKSDKRKFMRLSAHHLIKYQVVRVPQQLTFVRNISAGGVLFYAREEISPGSIVELTISFPSHPEPITARAKAVRVKRLRKMGGYEVGVEFIDIDDRMRELIRRQIRKVYQQKREREKKGGGMMRIGAIIFISLSFLAAFGGILVRFFDINIPVAPLSWVLLTSMWVLFAIEFTLLLILKKMK